MTNKIESKIKKIEFDQPQSASPLGRYYGNGFKLGASRLVNSNNSRVGAFKETEIGHLALKYVRAEGKKREASREESEQNELQHPFFSGILERIIQSNGNTLGVTEKYYLPFSYVPASGPAPANYIQGIGSGDTKGEFTLVGTSGVSTKTPGYYGTIFQGKLETASTSTSSAGTGKWTTMVVPETFNSLGTSIYGVHNRGDQVYSLCGTYASGNINHNIGWYYTGRIVSNPVSSDFKSFQASGINFSTKQFGVADETILHSVSGNVIVGNYDFLGEGAPEGHAFALDILTGQQTDLNYGLNLNSSAYAVWANNNDNYTIAGGETDLIKTDLLTGKPYGVATLGDFCLSTKTLSGLKTYQYANSSGKAFETHFEGIYYCGDGIYETAFTAVVNSQGATQGFSGVAFIKREASGAFSDNATWYTFQNPTGTLIASNDSVWANVSVGLQTTSSISSNPASYACELNLL